MPLVPILSQMNPVHAILSLRSILILSCHVHLELRSGLLLALIIIIITITIPHQLGLDRLVSALSNSFFQVTFVCLVCNSFFATKTPCMLHPCPSLLSLITQIKSGEQCKSRMLSVCSLPHYPFFDGPLRLKYLPQRPVHCWTRFHSHMKQRQAE